MRKIGSSILFDNVYLNASSTIVGPKEHDGPLKYYYDHHYNDLACNEDSWEKAEMRMQLDAIESVMKKLDITENDIDIIFSGDLNNQIAVSSYVMRKLNISHIGLYGACSTSVLGLINGSMIVEHQQFNYVGCMTSSHNATSERQFRYPTEYGGQKPESLTTTASGCGVGLISSIPACIKISCGTIGRVVDSSIIDAQDLGRAMAPACAETLRNHLHDFSCSVDDYDLILTGDLSKYGSEAFKKMVKAYGIELKDNYKDSGMMLYDLEKQHVHAGGSGCGCISLVTLGYVVKQMYENKLRRVLVIATGALMNPVMVAQKETIPAIAHAICLERV